ncbi:MAG TPA: TOBE domain-containing protein, partial [Pedococcus sp.]
MRVRTEHLAADITPAALAELGLAPGSPVVF